MSNKETISNIAQRGGFLPATFGYNECADLNGSAARKFLEANGFHVNENHDLGRCGVAITACGVELSTNGYCSMSAVK